MYERLTVETHTLKNGITLYSHKMDVPFFKIYLQVPVGSSHSHEGNKGGSPGIAHFIEHMLFNRSQKYPERFSFRKEIELQGGYWNAGTFRDTYTEIYVGAPLGIQNLVIEGLVDHVFNPVFTPEDMAIERTIVGNERDQKKYYPRSSKLGKYLDTEWMLDMPVPKRQTFGTDEDLASITPEQLHAFLTAYAVPGLQVVVGGGHDLAPIIRAFEAIPLHTQEITPLETPRGWKKKAFHSKAFDDLNSPTYYIGNIDPERLSIEDGYAMDFLLGLLTNSVHGPLYEWIRKEKGWSYGISYSQWSDRQGWSWTLNMPLNSAEHVEQIRSELPRRMQEAIADNGLIEREATRRLSNDVYGYQTLNSRLSATLWNLRRYDRIVLESHFRALLKKTAHSKRLQEIYDTYLAPDDWGEFLALPEGMKAED